MARTPDRRPGESDEEGIVFENRLSGSDPPLTGGMRYVNGNFRMRDGLGLFNPRAPVYWQSSEPGVIFTTGSVSVSGSLTGSGLEQGSVLFAGPTGVITGSKNSFYWNNSNGRLGIGTVSPAFKLDVTGSDIKVNGLRIGIGPGNNNTNTVIGSSPLASNTTGGNNVGIGVSASYSSTTANDVISIGANSSLYQIGAENIAIGSSALRGSPNESSGIRNTAIGLQAGYSLTAGGTNAFIGNLAGYYATSGSSNVFIGSQAGYNNSIGSFNVAIGFNALLQNTTGSSIVAIGANSGRTFSTTAAGGSIAIGTNAAYYQSGSGQTAIGFEALKGSAAGSAGTSNTAIGYQAGLSIAAANTTTFVGYQAGTYNTGNNNTAVGANALFGSSGQSTGVNHTCVGWRAGYFNTSGNSNGFFGLQAGYNNTAGSNNNAIGYLALGYNTTGGNNVALGHLAGAYYGVSTSQVTTGSNSIFIGYQARSSADSQTNQIVLGYDALGDGSNTAVYGNSSITQSKIAGNVVSNTNNTYDLGTLTNFWRKVFSTAFSGSTVQVQESITTAATTGTTYTKSLLPGEAGRFTATVDVAQAASKTFNVSVNNGAIICDVSFIVSENSFSVARKYSLVAQYGVSGLVVNKIADTGPYGSYDLSVTFTKVAASFLCTFSHNFPGTKGVALTIDIAATSTGTASGTTLTIF